ncbi:MAG TPA: CDP-alcohol phosphatidyltransferase family protein [Kiritimatiellia bacterium]|nr:CDP-alcohol phosphatidyltransferase family protein [Kiritimatiellia bacterium]HMO98785.1 CDP-alcohol phosphatidyltransferase family protein [Kiritimatiellia bacterium]HMP91087.1 CDP-alcohol phosphatidyltransferase family protein [Kiritimatiellia bacterium]
MTWRKIVPNLITLAALLASFFCLVAAANGQFYLAAQLIMLVLILDGLDGIMARLLRGTSKLGAELDTFVDMTGYGIAPAMILYYMIVPDIGIWAMVLVVLTIFSGAIRLSRFRIIDPYRGQHGYMGLPITVNAGWVAMVVMLSHSGSGYLDSLTLTSGLSALVIWGVSAAMVFLQVSRVRYGKPVKKPAVFILGAVMVILLFIEDFAMMSALAFCLMGLYYTFVSPFLLKHERMEEDEAEDPLHVQAD